MRYAVVMTTIKRGQDEPVVSELPFYAVGKNRLRKILYFSFPYGAWFVAEMMRKGRVKVTFAGDELLVNQDLEAFDMSVLYELKTLTKGRDDEA
jgi:hypothetical protein